MMVQIHVASPKKRAPPWRKVCASGMVGIALNQLCEMNQIPLEQVGQLIIDSIRCAKDCICGLINSPNDTLNENYSGMGGRGCQNGIKQDSSTIWWSWCSSSSSAGAQQRAWMNGGMNRGNWLESIAHVSLFGAPSIHPLQPHAEANKAFKLWLWGINLH